MRILYPAGRDLGADLRGGRLVPAILTGAVIGFMSVIIETSFASLLFTGPLSGSLSQGLGMLLAGSVISLAVLALTSSLPSVVSNGQDGPIPLLVASAGALSARFAALPPGTVRPDELAATVFAMIAVSTLMTGLLFLLVGKLKLSGFVRTIPYPVMGGFLAGTGWLLAKGGIESMSGTALTLSSLGGFLTPLMLARWLPGLAFALVTFALLARIANPFTLPICVVGAIGIAYAVFGLAGIPIGRARELGFLMEAVDSTPALTAFSPSMVSSIRWDQLAQALPAIMVTPLISMLSLVLNLAGIESGTGVEIDPDRELTRTGAANLVIGLVPAHASYTSMSLSMIGLKTGAKSRFIGIAGSLVVLLVILFGTAVLGYVPKAVLGGFLFLMGLFFLSDWIVESRKKMPLTDYLIVWAILVAVIVVGFMQGVLLGLAIAIVLFLGRISRVPACREPRSAADMRSRVVRPLPERRLLDTWGSAVGIYELEGYLFFGSASGFAAKVLGEARSPDGSPRVGAGGSPDGAGGSRSGATAGLPDGGADDMSRITVIDFTAVSGFDVSAVDNFTRLARKLTADGHRIAMSAAPARFRALLEKQAGGALASGIRWFTGIDEALAWAEDSLLARLHDMLQADSAHGREVRGRLMDQVSDNLMDELARRERVEALAADPAIAPCLVKHAAGQTVLEPGVHAGGFCLVASGTVSERETAAGAETKLRVLGQGDCFAAESLAGSWSPSNSWIADSDSTIAILGPEFVAGLEETNPGLALEIQRVAITRLAGDAGARA